MKKLLLGFVFIAFFFSMIRLFAPNTSETPCKLTQDFNNSQYIGRVMDKYIDSKNHSYPIVEIINSEDSILKLNLVLETNQLFNEIEVNSYIYKPTGNDTVFVIKNNERSIVGKADFGCVDSLDK